MKKKLLIGMAVGAGALYIYKMKNPGMIHDMKETVKDTCQKIITMME